MLLWHGLKIVYNQDVTVLLWQLIVIRLQHHTCLKFLRLVVKSLSKHKIKLFEWVTPKVIKVFKVESVFIFYNSKFLD